MDTLESLQAEYERDWDGEPRYEIEGLIKRLFAVAAHLKRTSQNTARFQERAAMLVSVLQEIINDAARNRAEPSRWQYQLVNDDVLERARQLLGEQVVQAVDTS